MFRENNKTMRIPTRPAVSGNFGTRRGVTLVEMLVVVGIMMFLVAIAVPAFQVNTTERQSREGARALATYLNEARAKAMTTGRPCGVAFIPFENYPEACLKAQTVETPPLFRGYDYKSTVTVQSASTPTSLRLTFNNASNMSQWLKRGNRIRFAGKGCWYTFSVDGGSTAILSNTQRLTDNYFDNFRPWKSPSNTGGWITTYEIQAAPVAESSNYLQAIGMASPLLLPRGTVVDLFYSGGKVNPTDNGGDMGYTTATGRSPMYIMFAPSGEVCEYSYRGMTAAPSGNIFLLVGKWDRALRSFVPEDGLRNYADFDNYWVVLDPSTGSISVKQIENTNSCTTSRVFSH